MGARVGAVSANASFDVDGKLPTPANLVLNAGTLQIKAQLQKSGALLGDAVISVSDAAQAVEGKKEVAASPIDMFKGADGQITLRPGAIWCASSRARCASSDQSRWRRAARVGSTLPSTQFVLRCR